MNIEFFVTNFAFLANAPGGPDKLRQLVLSMAMQGGLSERRENDTPVADLLQLVENEERSLVELGAIRKQPKPSPIGVEEMLHTIPNEWAWARFGAIAQHNAGKTLDSRRNTGTPRDYITTSNLYWGRFDLRELRQMLIRDDELERCTAKKGDLMICEGGEAGRAAVWNLDREVSFQNHVHRARFYGGIDPNFVFRFFQKLNYTGEINKYRKGVGISNMSGKALGSIVLPLPPLEEQKRIVAKTDELMALCDKLEAQQQERRELFPSLSRGCNATFTESPTSANLKRLFDEAGNSSPADLRRSILTLAIQGKLVPQDPNDETAEVVVKSARKRAGLAARSLTEVKSDGVPFEIPDSWRWVTVADVAETRLGKMLDRGRNRGQAYPYLRNTNVHWFRFELENIKSMLFESAELDEYRVEPGDVLICEGGHGIARSAVWGGQIGSVMFQKALHRVRPLSCLSGHFLTFCLWVYERDQILQRYYTGAGIPHFTGKALARVTFPLPPIAEQYRIVAKIDELIALVDKLETRQGERDQVADAFAKAVVATITGISTQEPESMKAPKTELITKLQTGAKPKPGDEAPLSKLLTKQKEGVSAKILWQQSDLEIDAFYHQLKIEMAKGWIVEPQKAAMQEVEAN